MIDPPYPEFSELLTLIGEACLRVSEIEASEGAAGNVSVYIGWPVDPRRLFPLVETIDLPEAVPGLAGGVFLVSGSGRRMREIIHDPSANLGCLVVEASGRTGKLYTSPDRLFARLTSEFNSHLAVHTDQVQTSGTNFHAVLHAQPPYLTYLSQVPAYRDETYLNRRLLRWQPETIMNLPEGIGLVPFEVPGSQKLREATVASMRRHRIAIWAKHGVVARSDVSVKRAMDRIEYAEAGARYEYMDLVAGGKAEGLTVEEIRAVCASQNIQQEIF